MIIKNRTMPQVFHWTQIQVPNYSIKPTLDMAYLGGEVIAIKTYIKGEKRLGYEPEKRLFLFDREYVEMYFIKNIFNPCACLTPRQFLTLFCQFYDEWLVQIKQSKRNEQFFLGKDGFKIYKLHGNNCIKIDDLLDIIHSELDIIHSEEEDDNTEF